MNLIDQNISDRLVEYVVVVGHRGKLVPFPDEYIEDPFAAAPSNYVPETEDIHIEGPAHELRYHINDYYGGPETDKDHPLAKTPPQPSLLPTVTQTPQRDPLTAWPEERIKALIMERTRIQESLLIQIQQHLFEADVLDRYPREDNKSFPFPDGIPLFCVPAGGLKVRKSPDIPRIYYFGCTMSDGARLYGACLSFQEEIGKSHLRGLMRRMEQDLTHREHWLSHAQYPPNHSYSQTVIDSIRDVDPNTVPLSVLERVRKEVPPLPQLWTSHCLCVLSCYPFLNEFRVFLTEIYRLTLTPTDVPIERLIATLVDDVPLPPQGLFTVQANVGPYNDQHRLATDASIGNCNKAAKGCLYTDDRSVNEYGSDSQADREKLFKNGADFVTFPPTIVPPEFKNNLTQAVQQSFLYFFKINSGRALEKNAIYGFNKEIAPLSLCGVHSLAHDLLPPVDAADQHLIPYNTQSASSSSSQSASNSGGDQSASSSVKSSLRRRLSMGTGPNVPQPIALPELMLPEADDGHFSLAHGSYPNTSTKYQGQIRYPPPLSFQPVLFFRPPPNDPLLPASIRVTTLFYNLDLEYVILIIEALLSERKVLILSDRLSLLAPVCEALLLLLYPFRWLHVYVPLLPKVLNAFLLAPMPFLIGATNSAYQIIDEAGIDDHVIVFLDENKLRYDDEIVKIPSKERKKLMDKLLPFTQFVKSKTPRDHHNPKYADSAFTLSPLPDDFDDADLVNEKESQTRTISHNSRSSSQQNPHASQSHPSSSASNGLSKDPSSIASSANGEGGVDPTIDMSLTWDPLTRADYNIKQAFLRMFISLFRDVYDYITRPVDYSHISPSWASTTLPHPQILPSQQYARVLVSSMRDSTSFTSSVSLSKHVAANVRGVGGAHNHGGSSPIEDDTIIVTVDTTPPSQHQLASNSSVFRSQVAKIGADHYLLDDDDDAETIFKRDAFVKAHPSSSKAFLQLVVHSQAFSRFIDERSSLSLAIMNRYHVVYFAESLIDKKNRSRFTRQKPTPFLHSTFHHFTSALLVPPPTGLQRGFHHFNQYHPSYNCRCGGNSASSSAQCGSSSSACLVCDCSHFSSFYTSSQKPSQAPLRTVGMNQSSSSSSSAQKPLDVRAECPLLHDIFHSHVPFVTRLPLRYSRFPRFDPHLFPLTMGRVPRIISIDGANVLSFIRLQLGLLFCSECDHTSSSMLHGGARSTGSSTTTYPPSGGQASSSPPPLTSPGGGTGIMSPPPVPVCQSSGSTFQTYTHTHASDIQFIPLNQGDVSFIKQQLTSLQGSPAGAELSSEFKSLNLANAKSVQLAVSWSHVQTNVTKSILKLSSNRTAALPNGKQHNSCVFFWLDAISPHGHAPLPLTCESFDNVDPMYYALKQYKNWVTTWHKKLTIPDSAPAEDELRLKQQQSHHAQASTAPPVTPTNQQSIQSALTHLLSPNQRGGVAYQQSVTTSTPSTQPRPEGAVTPLIVPANAGRLPFPPGSGNTTGPNGSSSLRKPLPQTSLSVTSSAASTANTVNQTNNANGQSTTSPKQINMLSMHPSLTKTQFSNEKYQNFASILYNTVGPRYASSFAGVLKTEFMREFIENLVPHEYQHLQSLVSVYLDTIGCINAKSNPEAKRGAGADLTTRTRFTRDTYIPSWLSPHLKQDYTRAKQLLISAKYMAEEMEGISKTLPTPAPILSTKAQGKEKKSFFWSRKSKEASLSPQSATSQDSNSLQHSSDDELTAFIEQGIQHFTKIIPSLSFSLDLGDNKTVTNHHHGSGTAGAPPQPPPFTPSSSQNSERTVFQTPPPPPPQVIHTPRSALSVPPPVLPTTPTSMSSSTSVSLHTPSASSHISAYTPRASSGPVRVSHSTCCPISVFGHAYAQWHKQATKTPATQPKVVPYKQSGHSRTLSHVDLSGRLSSNDPALAKTTTDFQNRSAAFTNPSSTTISIRSANYPSMTTLTAAMASNGSGNSTAPTTSGVSATQNSTLSSVESSGGSSTTRGGNTGSTIVTSYATPVRGLLTLEELCEASKFNCSHCGLDHNLYLTIRPSHGYFSSPLLSRGATSSSTAAGAPGSSTATPIRVVFVPSFVLLPQLIQIFSQRPIELIQSPIFRKTYPELFWSLLFTWALLRLDFSQYAAIHQNSE